ncbi:MAG TPA: STN domain-containing protein, partial [Draconibacterium sp.]|nr:STN domain-containing protein [Draconibacterium sp.]
MKKIRIRERGEPSAWNKCFRLIKLTILFFMIGLMQVSASVYSQTTKLTLEMKNSRVVDVLEEIEKQSEFRFAYSSELIDMNRRVSIELNEKSIDETMSALFDGTNVRYALYDRHIMLYPKEMDVVSEVSSVVADDQQ